MLHPEHYKTNLATGTMFSVTAFSFSIEYLIILISLLIGSLLGQYLGPDLDKKNSKPNQIGGKIILTILFILFLGLETETINNQNYLTIFLVGILFLLIKNTMKFLNEFFEYIYYIAAIYLFILYGFNIHMFTSGYFYYFIFLTIMIFEHVHRRFTHSDIMIFLTIIFSLLLFKNIDTFKNHIFIYIMTGYVLGYNTHLLMDFLGSKSMPYLFYPFKNKLKCLKIYKIGKGDLLVANVYIATMVTIIILTFIINFNILF